MNNNSPTDQAVSDTLPSITRRLLLLVLAAIIVLTMMIGLAVQLWQNLEEQADLVSLNLGLSSRPISQVQRETLRLQIAINQPNLDMDTILLRQGLTASRLFIFEETLERYQVQSELADKFYLLKSQWETMTPLFEQLERDPTSTEILEALKTALRQFELQVNDLSSLNERAQDARLARLQDDQTSIYQLLIVTSIVFTIFVGVVGYNMQRLLLERRRTLRALQAARNHLEERVADRTQRLQVITTLSGRLNAILDLEMMLAELVSQIQGSFGYFRVEVYLLDSDGQQLELAKTSLDLAPLRQKNVVTPSPLTQQVATQKQGRFDNQCQLTTTLDMHSIVTGSELAVPIRKRKQLIGVLTIQSEVADNFADDDLTLMQSLADQAAIAIDNARLWSEREATIVKLREVDRAKSQFITMVSHELRTPLNAINGFAEMMALGMSGDLSSQAQEDVELIRKNGNHLTRLVNDIIDISQIESGGMQINTELVSVETVVQELVTEVTMLKRDKPIEIVTDIPPDTPQIQADSTRFRQILLNLLSNAVKFTDNGTVTVRATFADPDWVRIAVIDTGIGISTDDQQLIFEKFRQVDMTDARQYGGTGLGLSICHRLVNMHGGEIGVTSEVGKGSEFWFTMPRTGQIYG